MPFQAVLLDLDGTVYRGSEPCPNAPEAIQKLLSLGLQIRYLTNNSAARPDSVTHKLNHMGIPCEPNWVISSGMTAAAQVARKKLSRVAIVGTPGLQESAVAAGLQLAEFDQAQAVLVGICPSFDYQLLKESSDAIRAGALFIATNRDATYPYEGNRLAPGAGSIVAAIEVASGVNPIVVGKPEPTMALDACQSLGIDPNQALMVGDRLDTDIECARRAGCKPWLVLTGVTAEIVAELQGSADLTGLVDYLTSSE
jgi:4-nitrophenyl phosphatase